MERIRARVAGAFWDKSRLALAAVETEPRAHLGTRFFDWCACPVSRGVAPDPNGTSWGSSGHASDCLGRGSHAWHMQALASWSETELPSRGLDEATRSEGERRVLNFLYCSSTRQVVFWALVFGSHTIRSRRYWRVQARWRAEDFGFNWWCMIVLSGTAGTTIPISTRTTHITQSTTQISTSH